MSTRLADLYIPRESELHATDPRVKLLAVVCSLLVLFVARNVLFMLAVLVFIHWLYWTAHLSLSNLIAVWKTLLPVSILMALLWTLFYPSDAPILQVWFIAITPTALAQGLVLALRILNIGLIIALWLYTTETNAIVQGMVKWRVPFEWGLVLTLALRYIPFVHQSYMTISEAQQARGLNLSRGKAWQRARNMLPIFIAMMVSILRASDQVAKALEARGFGGRETVRTSLYTLHATRRDYFLAAATLMATITFLLLNYFYGFASQAISLF